MRQLRVGTELLDEPGDLVATFPAALRADDAEHVELAEQIAERSQAGSPPVTLR
jgi:hypothetical protein